VRGLLLFALLLFGCAKAEVKFLTPHQGPVVVIGDSLSVGVGADRPEEGYVALLEKRLGIKIVNKGISGNTTEDGLARFEKDVLAEKPALVIIELGGNDFLRKVEAEQVFANLEKMIDLVQAQQVPVLLLGIQSSVLRDRHEADFRALAERKGTAYVPNIVADVAGNQALKADPIHPNSAGYVTLADRIEPELRRLVEVVQGKR